MKDRIIPILAEALGELPEKLIPTARLQEDLGCDSLDTLEAVLALECELEVDIPDSEWEALRTVQDVVDAIERHTT